jgi:hypothetical protein
LVHRNFEVTAKQLMSKLVNNYPWESKRGNDTSWYEKHS